MTSQMRISQDFCDSRFEGRGWNLPRKVNDTDKYKKPHINKCIVNAF